MVVLCQRLFEINEDMIQILLMLAVLFLQDSKVEGCSVVLLPALNPACFSAIISSSWGFKPIQDEFQHGFARMTDEAD